ncbi:MAG: putative toxin-antitoxin system toxin component, PIN family [Ottowia sp.]|nr:putative toxin-antitoxin system toxin component, PIN family [Ottowia sp.]
MRVVLDTNVLLAALISPYTPPDTIYRAWRDRRFELVTSTKQLEELRRVSRYPKLRRILPPHRVGAMVNNMQGAVVLERLPELPQDVELSDPDDAFLVATAIAGGAAWLVTGDRRAGLLQLGRVGGAAIVTPREFVREIGR